MSAFPGVSSYQGSSLGSKSVVIGVVCCQEMQRYALFHKVLPVLTKYFIQNFALSREREILSGYLDICNSNSKKRLSIHEALQRLKRDVSDRNTLHIGRTSCAKLYEIKRLAITQYLFYYNRHILYQGFRDLKDFFKPYIEAIICTNSDTAEKSTYLGDMQFVNEKYSLEYIDLDIITKFISTKDLSALVKAYNVKQLNAGIQEVTFLVESFKNLCHSIVTAKTYGLWQSSFSVLSNIALLLNLVNLDADRKVCKGKVNRKFTEK